MASAASIVSMVATSLVHPEVDAATVVRQKASEAHEEAAATTRHPDATASDADRGATTEQPGAQPRVTSSAKSSSVVGLRQLAGNTSGVVCYSPAPKVVILR